MIAELSSALLTGPSSRTLLLLSSPSVAQWLKAQEIAARRKMAHAAAERIWLAHPTEEWSHLTRDRSEFLLRSSGADPAEWDIAEFFDYTLATKCPWRHAELARERKVFFNERLELVLKELRAESDRYKHGTMAMTKNDLTRRLTAAMDGKLPSAAEVEDAWQDRHRIPAIDWVEDAI